MRFRGLDLNHLVTLEVLLLERHLTRASRRLNLTQPAVSHALTRLREHFRDPLLVRRGREMHRTVFGEQLLEPLQQTLVRIHGLASARPGFDAATANRTYRIVASDYVSTVLLGDLMLRLSKVAPCVKVEQLPLTDANIGRFRVEEADALICPYGNRTPLSPHQRSLFVEKFVCIASTGNHRVGPSLSVDEFYSLPRVGPPYKRYWPDSNWGTAPRASAIALPFASIPWFVSRSDHVAIVPERLLAVFEPSLPLRRIKLTTAVPSMRLTVQWHPAAQTDPFHAWMLDQLQSVGKHRMTALRPGAADAPG